MPVLVTICVVLLIVIVCQQVRIGQKNKEKKHLEEQLKAVASDYVSLHEFDLANDCFYEIKSNPMINSLTQENHTNIRFQIQNVMKGMSAESSRDIILEFVDTNTLLDRMEGKDIISCDFQGVKTGWCRAEFLWLEKDKKTVLFGVRTIDADKTREDGLRYLAEKDFLTGVYNADKGKALVSGAMTRSDTGMFGLFEIDDFKQVNDAVGSVKGDKLIMLMASSIQNALGADAIVYRRGGARFSAFLKDVDKKDDARFLLNQIIEGMNNLDKEEFDIDISVSIGVAFHRRQENLGIDELIEKAESGLSTSRAIDGVSVSYFD